MKVRVFNQWKERWSGGLLVDLINVQIERGMLSYPPDNYSSLSIKIALLGFVLIIERT